MADERLAIDIWSMASLLSVKGDAEHAFQSYMDDRFCLRNDPCDKFPGGWDVSGRATMIRTIPGSRQSCGAKANDGSDSVLRFVWRVLPRNGGGAMLLVCSYCKAPRRGVYG